MLNSPIEPLLPSQGIGQIVVCFSKAVVQLRMILEKIDNGQGTAAKLINDGRLYENLLENTQQIQVLLQEMKSFIADSRDEGVPIKLK